MQTKIRSIAHSIFSFISSEKFFWIIFVYFAVSSVWLALTALYPMAFDEEFHWGIINLYANQWSPFLPAHPDNAEGLSAVARDPSFFFHYLMSFPLRVVELFTDNETTQIVVLRLINVAMFAAALPIYRRLLLTLKASKFAVHTSLALFVLLPITPFLAAHINYDNALIPLVGVSMLFAYRAIVEWRAGTWSVRNLLILLFVALLASIIKYVYLPIALGILIFMAVALFRCIKSGTLSWKFFTKDAAIVKRSTYIIFGAAIVIVGVLFVQRYGVNMAQYGTPLPSCDQVISEQECQSYGPWARDTSMARSLPDDFSPDYMLYAEKWFAGMWKRSLFTIASMSNAYENYPPLPVIGTLVIVLAVGSAIFLVVFSRRIFKGNAGYQFMVVVTLTYIVIIFVENFLMYRETGHFVAMNGRYLWPVLPFVFVLSARAYGEAARALKAAAALPIAAAVILMVIALQGGGATAWIAQSSPSWYLDTPSVEATNSAIQKVLHPLIIGDKYE